MYITIYNILGILKAEMYMTGYVIIVYDVYAVRLNISMCIFTRAYDPTGPRQPSQQLAEAPLQLAQVSSPTPFPYKSRGFRNAGQTRKNNPDNDT